MAIAGNTLLTVVIGFSCLDPRLVFNDAKVVCDNGLISMSCLQIWQDMQGPDVDPPFFLKEVPVTVSSSTNDANGTRAPVTPVTRASGMTSTPSPPPAPAGSGAACLGDFS